MAHQTPTTRPTSSAPQADTTGAGGLSRRSVLGAGAALLGTLPAGARPAAAPLGTLRPGRRPSRGPVLVGSANGLGGMEAAWAELEAGAHPLDAALMVVKTKEADPNDHSVGLGGLPNEDGVVQLDSAVMDGSTHNSGAVAAIENILHPCEVARLVMERTDHCLIVGRGAYEFARMHGHPHTELLTEEARRLWLRWRERMSDRDDRLPPPEVQTKSGDDENAWRLGATGERLTGTIHCSALAVDGRIACTTTTSGLSYKVPGRVGDSPIVGAGLYCDLEAGSAGATGRGEAAILSNGSFAIVELMRQGATPLDAGMEVLRRIARQVKRQATWQSALAREDGTPNFGLNFYVVGTDGEYAGVTLRAGGRFAVADREGGPRREPLEALFDK